MGSASKVGDGRHHLSTKDKQKIRENEKYERNYRHWQQAKTETRHGQGAHFRERVALQHHLIRAQDELAHIKRAEEKQRIAQKRETEKADKHAREQALLSICRQSLDEDRRLSRTRKGQQTPIQETETPQELDEATPRSSLALVTEQLWPISKGKTNTTSAFQRRTLSPFVGEDDDVEEETDQSELKRKLSESLPWHHAQLYHLYGDKADYFLHPKIEPKPQKQLHPKLRNPCGGGAEVLWSGLRDESMARLRRYDRHVPKELKSAFSAFVRQNLTKNVNLVRRHYCTEEDVPEMPKLLDKTLLHKAMAYRHKLQLMHRSSQTNADRTRVLTFNNPLPDLNNLEGVDGIGRYLPSWLDEDVESSEYEKWAEEGKRISPGELVEALQDSAEGGRQETSELASDHQLGDEKPPHPKLKFMVPTEPQSNGGFSVKFKDKEKTPVLTPPREETRRKARAHSEPPRRENRSVRAASYRSDPRFTTQWQPLSMNALVEYTQQLDTRGRGGYRHGQSSMWQTQLPSQPALS